MDQYRKDLNVNKEFYKRFAEQIVRKLEEQAMNLCEVEEDPRQTLEIVRFPVEMVNDGISTKLVSRDFVRRKL